jgi:hypothetical protein
MFQLHDVYGQRAASRVLSRIMITRSRKTIGAICAVGVNYAHSKTTRKRIERVLNHERDIEPLQLKERRALVIGSGRGIGHALAHWRAGARAQARLR